MVHDAAATAAQETVEATKADIDHTEEHDSGEDAEEVKTLSEMLAKT